MSSSLSVGKQSSSPDLGKVNTSSRVKNKKKWGIFSNKASDYDEALSTEEKNRMITNLRNQLVEKDAVIDTLQTRIDRLENEMKRSSIIVHRKHPLNQQTHLITDDGSTKRAVATRGSVATANILRSLPDPSKSPAMVLAERFMAAFKNPIEYMTYLQSRDFASDIIEICDAMCELLEDEPRCHFLQSPVYVFGDIHGNLEDLHFFSDNLWKCGMELTAGKFLFLGDYVDRGLNCLECIAYLFGLKILCPNKLVLLRGNHETRSVNGWEEHYKEKSFLHQCKSRFGKELGESVWEEVNQCFDRLPLAAVIDHDIFCIHGGIPRPVPDYDNAIQAILALPNVAAVNPCYEHETDETQQVASDCIWSDPANEEQESYLDETGFGPSLRGGDCVCFGMAAIDDFLVSNQLSFIVRAHEAHAHGVSISKAARVFTVFSTSKDHGQGRKAMAGCILVDVDKIQVINRSPAYKNKYIHHRTSVGCDLTDEQLAEMSRLGLVRADSIEGRRHRSRSSRSTHMHPKDRSDSVGSEKADGKAVTHVVDFDDSDKKGGSDI
mmetsp:Transcript_8817/g.13197  ORF Transcript_8817/g.13197 Transcript_8817/m.13197 type:complete len:551 (-) Transcript_8817:239-1891(-)